MKQTSDPDHSLVVASSRIGLSPGEWRDIVATNIEPPTPEEWAEAMLSTVEANN